MKIIVSNNIRIENSDEKIKDYAENNLVMINPDYVRNTRLGYSNYKTPQYLVFYEINGNELILPFGCLTDLFAMCPLEVFENRIVLGEHITYKSNIKLFDYQERVCQKAVLRKNGIIVMPAGSGKTQTALEIVAKLGLKTLWITHTIDLLNQSYDRAKSNFEDVGLGKIANGKIQIGTHITFATVQTLKSIDLQEYADTWDCIIVDECHRVCGTPAKAGMFYKVINKLVARYKYGLTATPYRNVKGTEKAMFSLLGKTIIELDKDVIGDRIIPATIIKTKTNFAEIPDECLEVDGTIKYATLTTALSEDEERNNLILKLLRDCKNNYTLVLADRVKQLYYLQEKLGYGNVIDGKTKKDIREKAIEEVRTGKQRVLFATYGLAKEGLDIPRLDRLILASPHRDKATVIQAVGRIERKFENKEKPICYDLVDPIQYFKNMYSNRKSYYRKNNNEILEGGI